MAEDINQVVLIGRLTRDGELVYTNSGFPILKFSLALTKRRKVGEQWQDESHFFDVVVMGRRGEALTPYLLKGERVAISGHLRQERWEQDGGKRSRVSVIAEVIQLLGGSARQRNNEYPSEGRAQGGASPPPAVTPPPAAPPQTYDDDIPF